MKFLIGQRVIFANREIVTTIREPARMAPADQWSQWVRDSNGREKCVAIDNLLPLPGGQL